jgi:hypothetical protein
MFGDSGLGYGGFQKEDAYTPYAAGSKKYGFGARSNPTSGPIGPEGREGYIQRDQLARARRNAILQRMSAAQQKNYMDPDYLRGI